jgi:predicted transcriptional regulator
LSFGLVAKKRERRGGKLRSSEDTIKCKKGWGKICRQGRKCFVSYNPDRTLGALMIYKEEDEAIESKPPLPKKKRIKLATMIVTNTGNKIGEFFIKKVIEIAMQKGLNEVYLTHFDEEDDLLIPLIESFGFKKVADKDTFGAEESIYLKRLHFFPGDTFKHPFEVSYCCYPSYYDGDRVRKFVIPIQGPFHERIFTDQTRQVGLFEFAGEHVVAGNTMKKAYLCHAKIKTMKQGDIVIFYRSQDKQEILTLGVIESVYQGKFEPEDVVKLVGKRTVYSREEIDEMSLKQLTIILFRHHFHFKKPLSLNDLKKLRVIAGPPQSIMVIDHEKYLIIKKEGGIDESYTVN